MRIIWRVNLLLAGVRTSEDGHCDFYCDDYDLPPLFLPVITGDSLGCEGAAQHNLLFIVELTTDRGECEIQHLRAFKAHSMVIL